MLLATMMFLQAASVGQPIVDDVAVEVRSVRRVGQSLTVDYTLTNRGARVPVPVPPPAMLDPIGRRLEARSPSDQPDPPALDPSTSEIAPGVTVGRSVTFEMVSDTTRTVSAARFNQSLWYFVIGGQRVPFRF